MTLIIEKWVYCTECKEKWKPEDQDFKEGDEFVHMCSQNHRGRS